MHQSTIQSMCWSPQILIVPPLFTRLFDYKINPDCRSKSHRTLPRAETSRYLVSSKKEAEFEITNGKLQSI